MVHNSFAYEGSGIQLLLASPVHFREVLLAKNLAHRMTILCEAVTIWLLVGLLINPPGAMILGATFAALTFATLVHFTVGNLLSVHFPRHAERGLFRHRAGGVTMLAGLGLQIGVLGPATAIFALARWLRHLWLATVIFLVLGAAALWVYVWMLDRCSRIAIHSQEVLTAELCRD
jgi:hypothetical protein